MYSIGQNINSLERVRPVSADYGQDFESSFGPIFTNLYVTQLPLNIPNKIFLGSPWNGRGEGHVVKFVILHPLVISAARKDIAFKFYTELKGTEEYYNKIYVQMAHNWAWSGSRNQFCNFTPFCTPWR